MTDVKIDEAEFGLNMKEAEVVFKVQQYLNEYTTTRDQINLFTRTTVDTGSLLAGEREMFNNGESSLSSWSTRAR